jgi:hypothetical protein
MNPGYTLPLDARAQQAVEELQGLIHEHYPTATFVVQRGEDDPTAIHLIATVDLDDTDAVLDLVIERMMAFQIEEYVPVFVIPVRPAERVRVLLATTQVQSVASMPLPLSHA